MKHSLFQEYSVRNGVKRRLCVPIVIEDSHANFEGRRCVSFRDCAIPFLSESQAGGPIARKLIPTLGRLKTKEKL
jgi:hypothetical protein